MTTPKTFPFNLSDLRYFIIRRKDGLTIKYNIIDPAVVVGGGASSSITTMTKATGSYAHYGLAKWCQHQPAENPLFSTERLDLYIADCTGFRNHYKEFSFSLDCGDILTSYQIHGGAPTEMFVGDKDLSELLAPYVMNESVVGDPRILQIDWDDRKAPKLMASFWPALVEQLEGTALIACQGGHGRSGTGAVCMMMVMNPEYSPADAIIHLRAIHCARAIESKEQHEYIGRVGEYLGRVNDIARIGGVNSFKEEFMKLTHASAAPYQEQLSSDIAAKKVSALDAGVAFD